MTADGHLDLFVANYVDFDLKNSRQSPKRWALRL